MPISRMLLRVLLPLLACLLFARGAQAAVPPPSRTPAKVIVNGNTSTAVDIKIVKVGKEVPDTYSGKLLANTSGFDWYVSEHYALKSQMGDDFSRHILEISELAYPHWVELTGCEPPDPNKRMAVIYAKDRKELNRAMRNDWGGEWKGGGGGITLWNNMAAYNYPSGTLNYHKRDLIIHENLHLLQGVSVLGRSMGTEGFTHAGANHVYDDAKKQLTVSVFDKATVNNPIDTGLAQFQNPEKFVSIQDYFAKGGWFHGGGYAVFTQFYWTDPDRLMKWRLLRDAMYNGRLGREPITTVAEEIFGPLDKLNDDWKAWLKARHNSFHFVEWGWEQSGNALWSYGWPWNRAHYSQTNLRYAPGDKVKHDPLCMDYPAEPMPLIVGPVKRGVDEPAIGCVVDFTRDPNRGLGGLGLGVEGTDHCPVVIHAGRELIVGGYKMGVPRKAFPVPKEVREAAAQDGRRFGVTIQIKKKELEITVRAGKPDKMKEMKAAVPVTDKQRKRIMRSYMAIIAKGGYQGVTPFIDDMRKMPPDLTKPAPANLWRFDGLDRLYTLYVAAHRLQDDAPKSLLDLKAEMLAAVDKEPAVQAAAKKKYEGSITAVLRDVQKCRSEAKAKGHALAALAGVTPRLAVLKGERRDEVKMPLTMRGLLKDDVTCAVSFSAAGAESVLHTDPIKVVPYRLQTVARTCRITKLSEPKVFTATLKLSWRGEDILVPLSEMIADTSIAGWWLIGPFDNPGGHGADVKQPIETEKIDLAKKYKGRGGEIAWCKIKRDPQAHVIAANLVDFIKLFGQKNNVAAYAFTWLDADKACDALLALGSDDGVVVWLNSKEVHRNLVGRGYSSRQDRVPIHLKKGRNGLLIKITQGVSAWNFCAHLEDKDGGTLRGVRASLDAAL